MYKDLVIFLKRLNEYSFLEEEKKETLIRYFKNNFFDMIFYSEFKDFEVLEKIIEKLNWDCDKIGPFFSVAKTIRSSKNPNIKPTCQYLETLLRIFNEFNLNYLDYNVNDVWGSNVLDYAVKRILDGREMLNDEVSIIDFSHQIYNKYYSNKDPNTAIVKIFKILDSVEKGINNKKDRVFLSKRIMDLFECSQDISQLSLKSIVEEYYPYFQNELFSIIKRATQIEELNPLDTYKLTKYLADLKSKEIKADFKRKSVIDNILEIELDTEEKVKQAFSDLIDLVKSNKFISEDMKETILEHIGKIYRQYENKEVSYVEETLKEFFNNCSYFIYDLIVPSVAQEEQVKELINECLSNCKDFFVEYDGRCFKDIVNYLINNTSLEMEDLIEVSKKCADIFKTSNVEKLKLINEALVDFMEHLNVNEISIFDDVFVDNPQLLVEDEGNLIHIIEFLKGNINLKEYGYKGEFRLPSNFLGKDFYQKIKDNEFKDLFNIEIGDIINNLNFVEGVCISLGISFKDLKISEDMVYFLLSKNLLNNYDFMKLSDFFSNSDLKKIIEFNPYVLTITDKQISLIVEKSLRNENDNYSFLDLLSSELYFYNQEYFLNNSDKKILNYDFKYIDLPLDKDIEYDILEVATSGVIVGSDINDIWNLYEERAQLKELLDSLNEDLEFADFCLTLQKIHRLYSSLYQNVPCPVVENKIRDQIGRRIEKYQANIEMINDKVEFKDLLIRLNSFDLNIEYIESEDLEKLLKSLESGKTKEIIGENASKTKKDIRKLKKKEIDLRASISSYLREIGPLSEKIERLNIMLQLFNSIRGHLEVNEEFEEKKSFSINLLSVDEDIEKGDQIVNLLGNENLIIFSDSVDLDEIPNDRNFFERINKFLGRTDFSLLSREFMQRHSADSDFIEKYSASRREVWARRENRTPVRVYFTPVNNRHFPCYYVYSVNYKDHDHLDGDCSTDVVYNARVKEKGTLEKKINSLSSIGEVEEFIRFHQERYEKIMEPIVSKMKKGNRKV